MSDGTTRYRFTIPNFPKEIYTKFQELRKGLDLTQQQCLILGILAICELGKRDLTPSSYPDHIASRAEPPSAFPLTFGGLVEEVKEKYASKKASI